MTILFRRSVLLFGMIFLFSIVGCKKKTEERHYVVGIINPTSTMERVINGFKDGMAAKGYHEGRNIRYVYDGPLENLESAGDAARKMIADKVDLIYTMTTPVTSMVKAAVTGTKTPVVFGPVFSPEVSGLVTSLSQPGGNLTGIKVRGGIAKGLDWFKVVLPEAHRVFIPFHYTDEAACMTLEDLEGAAEKLDIELVTARFSTAEELSVVLENIPSDVDAVWLTCSYLLFANVDRIIAAAEKRNLPIASGMHLEVKGVLLAYGEEEFDLGHQVSRIADRILRGESPAIIPVEPARYTLRLDLKVAERLGIYVPDTVLFQVDEIIR